MPHGDQPWRRQIKEEVCPKTVVQIIEELWPDGRTGRFGIISGDWICQGVCREHCGERLADGFGDGDVDGLMDL